MIYTELMDFMSAIGLQYSTLGLFVADFVSCIGSIAIACIPLSFMISLIKRLLRW